MAERGKQFDKPPLDKGRLGGATGKRGRNRLEASKKDRDKEGPADEHKGKGRKKNGEKENGSRELRRALAEMDESSTGQADKLSVKESDAVLPQSSEQEEGLTVATLQEEVPEAGASDQVADLTLELKEEPADSEPSEDAKEQETQASPDLLAGSETAMADKTIGSSPTESLDNPTNQRFPSRDQFESEFPIMSGALFTPIDKGPARNPFQILDYNEDTGMVNIYWYREVKKQLDGGLHSKEQTFPLAEFMGLVRKYANPDVFENKFAEMENQEDNLGTKIRIDTKYRNAKGESLEIDYYWRREEIRQGVWQRGGVEFRIDGTPKFMKKRMTDDELAQIYGKENLDKIQRRRTEKATDAEKRSKF